MKHRFKTNMYVKNTVILKLKTNTFGEVSSSFGHNRSHELRNRSGDRTFGVKIRGENLT